MASNREGTWDGGYIRRGVYVIRRSVGGKRYEVSTRATTTRGALAQLQRFEADPANYTPVGDMAPAMVLDEGLLLEFLTWSRDVQENCRTHVRTQRTYLIWWTGIFAGRDLRKLDLGRDIIAPMEGLPNRRARIFVLKALFGWLVKVRHILKQDEDPTWSRLPVPQVKPEQITRTKVISVKDRELLTKKLAPRWRDIVQVLAGTGWHVTEVHRFAGGVMRDGVRVFGSADIVNERRILRCPQRKSGEPQSTEVSPQVFEAGKRVLAAGSFSVSLLYLVIKRAAPGVSPGRFRHTVATEAVEAGATLQAVSAFLGHRSTTTTKRFYATHAVPPKVPTRE